ncbi:hypothetical protein CsSME_00005579 [Camellia sinensis var. sinensis]
MIEPTCYLKGIQLIQEQNKWTTGQRHVKRNSITHPPIHQWKNFIPGHKSVLDMSPLISLLTFVLLMHDHGGIQCKKS